MKPSPKLQMLGLTAIVFTACTGGEPVPIGPERVDAPAERFPAVVETSDESAAGTLRLTSPVGFDGDEPCEGTPDLMNVETTQTMERPRGAVVYRVHSTSNQMTSRAMYHFVGNDITIKHAATGGIVEANPVSHSMMFDTRNPEVRFWCAESKGTHRAWNEDGEEVDDESHNARGCVHITTNDPADPDDIIPNGTRGG